MSSVEMQRQKLGGIFLGEKKESKEVLKEAAKKYKKPM